MKNQTSIIKAVFPALLWLLAGFSEAEPLTLSAAYKKALVRSEALALREQDVLLAKARYEEATSAFFPQVNIGASEQLRNGNSSSTSSDNGDFGSGSSASSAGSRSRLRTSLSFTQPIFRGFREFLLADAAKFEQRAAELTHGRERELVYLDVATIYQQIYLDTLDLKVLERTRQVLDERLKELRDWVQLGKSKASEISAADAEKADLLALMEQVRGTDRSAREFLTYLLGEDVTTATLQSPPAVPNNILLDAFLERGQQRADIQAADQLVAGLRQQVTAAQRERWPSINLDGNFYPYQHPESREDWDVFLSAQMPIFDAGRIDARVSQQQSLLRQRELRLQQLKRLTERDIRASYQQLISSQARAKSLKVLVADSERSYEAQRADYKLGIVTNLDVLQAIRQLEDARRRLLAAEVESQLSYHRLAVASGEVPE